MTYTLIDYWKSVGMAYLVRGVGKRAICVIVRPILHLYGETDASKLLYKAAEYAQAKGWKTVYVEPDHNNPSSILIGNIAMFQSDESVVNMHRLGTYIQFKPTT